MPKVKTKNPQSAIQIQQCEGSNTPFFKHSMDSSYVPALTYSMSAFSRNVPM